MGLSNVNNATNQTIPINVKCQNPDLSLTLFTMERLHERKRGYRKNWFIRMVKKFKKIMPMNNGVKVPRMLSQKKTK